MKVWYIIIIAVLIVVFIVIERIREKRDIAKIEKFMQENKKEWAENAEKQEEAAKIKQNVRTGDHCVDLNNMVNKLHDLAGD